MDDVERDAAHPKLPVVEGNVCSATLERALRADSPLTDPPARTSIY